jgi:hypothetical protein
MNDAVIAALPAWQAGRQAQPTFRRVRLQGMPLQQALRVLRSSAPDIAARSPPILRERDCVASARACAAISHPLPLCGRHRSARRGRPMLRAEPLYRVQLLMLASEAQDAALTLARFGAFNPAPCALEALEESPAVAYREAWLQAEARLSKLLEQCGDTGPLNIPADAEAPALADLEELNAWLKDVWTACLACHESEAQIAETRSHLDALEGTLANWSG